MLFFGDTKDNGYYSSQQMIGSRLRGGFAHSPIHFNFEVNQTIEGIDRVYFVVDGEEHSWQIQFLIPNQSDRYLGSS